jgi:hypothetical protein
MSNEARNVPPCPNCAGTDVRPIAYGLPGAEMAEDAARGKIKLGGCIVMPGNPDFHCNSCGLKWDSEGDEP